VSFPNDVIGNVNGVRKEFLDIGDRQARRREDGGAVVYFLGKAVFPKGWSELLSLLESAGGRCADIPISAYGSGPDWDKIAERAAALRQGELASIEVSQEVDHADECLRRYAIFANPSTSEILCTVTAEAIAMRKRVVLPSHPSNRFFLDSFADRCHAFEAGDAAGFEAALRAAAAAGPAPPLSAGQRELLSWDAAVERLFDSAEVHVLSGDCARPSQVRSAKVAYEVHHGIQKDTPSLGNLLKSATLRSRSPLEETFAQLQDSEYGKKLFSEVMSLPAWTSREPPAGPREARKQPPAEVGARER